MSLPVDPAQFSAFLAVMSAMAVFPGPANLFAIACGLGGNSQRVFAAVAGLNVGTLIWFIAAILGLNALLMAFPQVFVGLAVFGALYLIWLGAQALWAAWHTKAGVLAVEASGVSRTWRQDFMTGMWVQIANPKAILFFTAILPPFIDPDRDIGMQMGLFALATFSMDISAMLAYGLMARALSSVVTKPLFQRFFNLAVGALLGIAGVMMLARAVHDAG